MRQALQTLRSCLASRQAGFVMASRCEEFVNPRGATGARPERAAAREGGRSFFSCFVPSFVLSYSIDDIRPEKSRKYGFELLC